MAERMCENKACEKFGEPTRLMGGCDCGGKLVPFVPASSIEALERERDSSLRASTVLTIKLREAIRLLTTNQHHRYLDAIADIQPDGSRSRPNLKRKETVNGLPMQSVSSYVEQAWVLGGACDKTPKATALEGIRALEVALHEIAAVAPGSPINESCYGHIRAIKDIALKALRAVGETVGSVQIESVETLSLRPVDPLLGAADELYGAAGDLFALGEDDPERGQRLVAAMRDYKALRMADANGVWVALYDGRCSGCGEPLRVALQARRDAGLIPPPTVLALHACSRPPTETQLVYTGSAGEGAPPEQELREGKD